MTALIPEAEALDGSERLIGRQGDKLRRFPLSLLRRWVEPTLPHAPSMVRVRAPATSALGKASILFPAPFVSPPEVWAVPLVTVKTDGTRLLTPIPSAVTAKGCDVTVYQTRGTLLVGSSPIEIASGAVVEIIAYGILAKA